MDRKIDISYKLDRKKIFSNLYEICSDLKLNITTTQLNFIYMDAFDVIELREPPTISKLINAIAETSAKWGFEYPDYAVLAKKLFIQQLQEDTKDKFSDVIKDYYDEYEDSPSNTLDKKPRPLIEETINKYKNVFDWLVEHSGDLFYTYFGLKILKDSSCLKKFEGEIAERPQHMLMRIAVALYDDSVGNVTSTYNFMALGYFIYPIQMMSNACAPAQQLSSCFLRAMPCYLEPWHHDILDVLNSFKNSDDGSRGTLCYALWIPDLFMERVKDDKEWTLFQRDECPDLHKTWGIKFRKTYEQYEQRRRNITCQMKARDLWKSILKVQIETGMPYVFYKDKYNSKSNLLHRDTNSGRNFSTEIIEYTSPTEVSVGNCGIITLNKFVDTEWMSFDFKMLREITAVVTRSLDRVIDVNESTPEAEQASRCHRPISIEVQGLADVFLMLQLPFESPEAQELNKQIFETVYYSALEESCKLARDKGAYESYKGSPMSYEIFQYDMWDVAPSEMWDWPTLKDNISKYGVRNSVLLACTPTVKTALIMGCSQSVQPWESYVIKYNLKSEIFPFEEEFSMIHPRLRDDLFRRELWGDKMAETIKANNGSVENIESIPQDIKELYKTVWEISQKTLLRMAADRGAFIDQSQSFAIYLTNANTRELESLYFYAWELGLKAGIRCCSRN